MEREVVYHNRDESSLQRDIWESSSSSFFSNGWQHILSPYLQYPNTHLAPDGSIDVLKEDLRAAFKKTKYLFEGAFDAAVGAISLLL